MTDDFELPEFDEAELEKRHEDLIDNQPEYEPNDGCDGGGCTI